MPVLGIEPAANVAEVAAGQGHPDAWSSSSARETARAPGAPNERADLLVGNNVLAHVPDLNDFVGGLKILLKPDGRDHDRVPAPAAPDRRVASWTPSTTSTSHTSRSRRRGGCSQPTGCALFDVEELPTHGGSLRIYGCHDDDAAKPDGERARELLAREDAAGYSKLETYLDYGARVAEDKRRILEMLIALKDEGKRIVGYGAAAKGNTLLNYCGIGRRLPRLHGRPEPAQAGPPAARDAHPDPRRRRRSARTRPDVVLILPWNLKDEIVEQLGFIREWGGTFVVRTPELDAAAVRLVATPLPGAYVVELEPIARRARAGSPARSTPRRSSRSGSTPASVSATSRSTRRPERCAGCTSRRRRTARRSWCAAPAARSTT